MRKIKRLLVNRDEIQLENGNVEQAADHAENAMAAELHRHQGFAGTDLPSSGLQACGPREAAGFRW